MSEPPPSPLATMPPRPRKDQTAKSPCIPSLGSQKFLAVCQGLRGNDPGRHGFPRSSRQADIPASARRYVVTEPPKPDPTTTASSCASGSDGGRSTVTGSTFC